MKQLARTLYQNHCLRKLRQKIQSATDCKPLPVALTQTQSDSSVKYGLLRYAYIGREGYWVDGCNIGDYIQSIAARQFLPRVDRYVERDSIADYQGDRVRVIMNGWWHIYKGNAVPSSQIEPLYVSIHITNPDEVPPEMLEHLKRYEPIGCRDYSTLDLFQNL